MKIGEAVFNGAYLHISLCSLSYNNVKTEREKTLGVNQYGNIRFVIFTTVLGQEDLCFPSGSR